jgi:hypothetical protein
MGLIGAADAVQVWTLIVAALAVVASLESGQRNHLLDVARLAAALAADLAPLIEGLQALARST